MGEQDDGFSDELRAVLHSAEAERQALATQQERRRIHEARERQAQEKLQTHLIQRVAIEAKDFAIAMREYGRQPDMGIAFAQRAVYPAWILGFASLLLIEEETERYSQGIFHHTYTRGLALDVSGEIWEFGSYQHLREYERANGLYVDHPPKAAVLVELLKLAPVEAVSREAGIKVAEAAEYLMHQRTGTAFRYESWPYKLRDIRHSRFLPEPAALVVTGHPSAEALAPLTAIDTGIAAIEDQPIMQAFRARFREIAQYGS